MENPRKTRPAPKIPRPIAEHHRPVAHRAPDQNPKPTEDQYTLKTSALAPPPPAPPEEPKSSATEKPAVSILSKVVLALVGISCLLATHYWLVTKPIADFVDDPVEIEVTRELPAKAEFPKWNEIITPEVANRVAKGHSLKLILLTKENGKTISRQEEILIPSAPEPTPGPRKRLLAEARSTTMRRVEALNSIETKIVKFAFLVDSTFVKGKADLELLTKQLELQLTPELVEQTTKKGYAVKVFFHRLSSTPSYAANFVGAVEIAANSQAGSGQDEIADNRREISRNLKGDKSSALIGGILNAIYEDGLTSGDHVLVFSDGLECCKLFDWENGDPSDVSPRKWDGIFQKMEAAVPNMPEMSGINIDWYLPSREDKAEMMTATMKLWKAFFQKAGKTVNFREHQ